MTLTRLLDVLFTLVAGLSIFVGLLMLHPGLGLIAFGVVLLWSNVEEEAP